jgi:hypothetical protein
MRSVTPRIRQSGGVCSTCVCVMVCVSFSGSAHEQWRCAQEIIADPPVDYSSPDAELGSAQRHSITMPCRHGRMVVLLSPNSLTKAGILPSKWPVTKQQPNPQLRLPHDVDLRTAAHPQACTPSLVCPCMRLPSLCFGKRSKAVPHCLVGAILHRKLVVRAPPPPPPPCVATAHIHHANTVDNHVPYEQTHAFMFTTHTLHTCLAELVLCVSDVQPKPCKSSRSRARPGWSPWRSAFGSE